MLKLSGKAVALGAFDGLHKGHMTLINEVVKSGLPSVLFSIGDYAPWIMQREVRDEILEVNHILEQELTPEFKNLTPDEFFETFIAGAKLVVVGFNFCYGKERSGNVKTLGDSCRDRGIELRVIPPVTYKDKVISSSRIRQAILKGDLILALSMLGRPYMVRGDVIKGAGIGGEWGIHTANMEMPDNLILPPKGVYMTLAEVEGKYYPAVTNYGARPTVGRSEKAIETHIIDYNNEIYGNNITIHFYKKIREIEKYESFEALKSQINKDILKSREYFLYKKQNLC